MRIGNTGDWPVLPVLIGQSLDGAIVPSFLPMSQNSYELSITVTGHTGTITTLQFSPDCKFLASGSNHGVLLIFSTSSWRPLKRLIDASPITTAVWHDTERYLLLCGCESGDLYFLRLTESLVRPCSLNQSFVRVVTTNRKSLSIQRRTLKGRFARYQFHQIPLPSQLVMAKMFLSQE